MAKKEKELTRRERRMLRAARALREVVPDACKAAYAMPEECAVLAPEEVRALKHGVCAALVVVRGVLGGDEWPSDDAEGFMTMVLLVAYMMHAGEVAGDE